MQPVAGEDRKARPEWTRIILSLCRMLCLIVNYEGVSVNRSQMGIKLQTRDITTLKKHLFLDISSTNTDIVPSLY
jgi:hypothetical protein